MKKLLYNNILKQFLRMFFSMFYDKKYLKGKYFDVKRMGWWWAFRGLKGRIFGDNTSVQWPVHPSTIVSNSHNIEFDPEDLHIFQTPGCYWQNHRAKIKVGKGSYIGPNVGLITTNHDITDIDKHVQGKDIIIGEKSWIGMNAMILPGVTLGPNSIVGAGSVVTKSFESGRCVIGGNPAKIIKTIDYLS